EPGLIERARKERAHTYDCDGDLRHWPLTPLGIRIQDERGRGTYSKTSAGTGTPYVRSCWARVTTAAPSRRFRPICTIVRFSGASRKVPLTHALNAPIAGPHQI